MSTHFGDKPKASNVADDGNFMFWHIYSESHLARSVLMALKL